MFKRLRSFARKLAGFLVTYYYNRCYRKAVAEADRRHEEGGGTMYVVDHLVKDQTLTVIDRAQFRKMKHDMQKIGLHNKVENWQMYWSERYGTGILKEGAWYHTPDRSGQNGLSEVDREARRLFFIRVGLFRAKLIDSLK